jgi:hypothetical protein
MNVFNTPILLLVFNRPDLTKIVFDKIRIIRPTKLFISCDGPREDKQDEVFLVEKVRNLFNDIDWKCEVKTLFKEKNLGCGKCVSEAITWFFENVEEGIIIEDDCLPDESFFRFCAHLLDEFRTETKISHIGGSNFQFGKVRGDGDYYYTTLSHVWGWATWRRAWKNYEFDLNKVPLIAESTFRHIFNNNELYINYYKNIFSLMRNGAIDTWDYQWMHANILNDCLSICPNRNLIKNIGFRADGTHTLEEVKWNTENEAQSIESFRRPLKMEIDYVADNFTLSEIIGIKSLEDSRKKVNIFKKIFNSLLFKSKND